jgi:rfaE bifunctional protein kinase chain/domain
MTKFKNADELFRSFEGKPVLVIGDVMIDSYIWGHAERISPEAPVPVVSVIKREDRLGGAANVAMNIKAMGAIPILCTAIGPDNRGTEFLDLLIESELPTKGIVTCENRITTVKFRVISNGHHMIRVDEEDDSEISDDESASLYLTIKSIISKDPVGAIIFEDYDKGVISTKLIEKVVSLANKNNIPTIVDPKRRNFHSYKNVTLFKPNLKELRDGLYAEVHNKDTEKIIALTEKLHKKLNHENSMVTLSELGMLLYAHKEPNAEPIHIPAHIRNISDVSGAGDTVTAIAALCLASGTDLKTMATLANLAGGLVCEEVGVMPIVKERFLVEARKTNLFA